MQNRDFDKAVSFESGNINENNRDIKSIHYESPIDSFLNYFKQSMLSVSKTSNYSM